MQPGIEPRSPRPLVNTLPAKQKYVIFLFTLHQLVNLTVFYLFIRGIITKAQYCGFEVNEFEFQRHNYIYIQTNNVRTYLKLFIIQQ